MAGSQNKTDSGGEDQPRRVPEPQPGKQAPNEEPRPGTTREQPLRENFPQPRRSPNPNESGDDG